MRLAHSLILYKYFRQSRGLIGGGDSRQAAGWAAALGEPFESAIQRLIHGGYLQPSEMVVPLSNLLEFAFSVTQLRSLLHRQRLKVSGRKSEIAARLVANNPDVALATIRGMNYYSRSPAGDELAAVYVSCNEAASEKAILAFEQGDYAEAIEIAKGFDRELGFPSDQHFGLIRPPEWFGFLAGAKPSILDSIPDSLLADLRQEVFLGALGLGACRPHPQKWCPAERNHSRLERQFARNMLTFSATSNYDKAQAMLCGVKRVKIHGARNVNSLPGATEYPCSFCTNLDGTVWEIEFAPELPHPNCTHPYGCRCVARPLYE